MKKNKMMRLASGLLVAVLLTSSIVSGTFAKYTTSASGNDTARVAKWGVALTVSSDLFAKKYADNDAEFDGDSVIAATVEGNQDDVIAPGTSGTAAIFSITGTPEVAVRVAVTLNKDDALKMVTLPIGDYDDPTNIIVDTDLKLTQPYQPVKWTLKRANDSSSTKQIVSYDDAGTTVTLENVNLATVNKYLAKMSKDYVPKTKLDDNFGYYELSWTWGYNENSAADTFLGNLAANENTISGAVLNETFKLSITVDQID